MILKQEPEEQASTTSADILKGMKVRPHFKNSGIQPYRDLRVQVSLTNQL